jgi:hypothetical protein
MVSMSSPSLETAVAGMRSQLRRFQEVPNSWEQNASQSRSSRFTLAKISMESVVPVNSDMIPFKALLFGGQNGTMDWLASRTK